jgi:Lon protease-like protein
VAEPRFTDEQVDAAVDALTEPERFRQAEMRVTRIAPQLQRILAQALSEGGWFGEAHESEVHKAATAPDDADRVARIKTLLAEETRMGMLVGVAIGWELARVLEMEQDDQTGD